MVDSTEKTAAIESLDNTPEITAWEENADGSFTVKCEFYERDVILTDLPSLWHWLFEEFDEANKLDDAGYWHLDGERQTWKPMPTAEQVTAMIDQFDDWELGDDVENALRAARAFIETHSN